jgi:predicted nucleic acid-binding protein
MNTTNHVTAIYDACVLYPAPLRDLLMQLAMSELFSARWTTQIHDEWMRNVHANRTDITWEKLIRVRDLMNSHVEESLVDGYEHLIPILDLPDPDDRHVLAAAIIARADLIVTFNLKDFPANKLEHYSIEAVHPDDFIADLILVYPQVVADAVDCCRQRLRNPPRSVDEFLEILLRQGLTRSCSLLRQNIETL